jgi:hypothetical protein
MRQGPFRKGRLLPRDTIVPPSATQALVLWGRFGIHLSVVIAAVSLGVSVLRHGCGWSLVTVSGENPNLESAARKGLRGQVPPRPPFDLPP